MDTLRGNFDSSFGNEDWRDHDPADDETGIEPPPAGIGTDERRMQVRAYNHWASMLQDRTFPAIEDLEPEQLPDFGPHSVLLDFTNGVDDPSVRYLGKLLAVECGADHEIASLSDVPPRSLLSRITDHYMQILANQAPIGFEAEFVNQRGATILYRGILLPYSSDDDTIDFIFGVINWKEMADQITTDELLLEIDQALEDTHRDDPVTEWADAPVDPAGPASSDDLPRPSFGLGAESAFGEEAREEDESEDEGEDEGEEGGAADESRFASLLHISPAASGGYASGADTDEGEVEWNREFPAHAQDDAASPGESKDDGSSEAFGRTDGQDTDEWADEWDETGASLSRPADAFVRRPTKKPVDLNAPVPSEFLAEDAVEETVASAATASPVDLRDLHDCLADARDLAQAASNSEDRSRAALYAAVGRAYDVSLAARDDPREFDELIAENGLSVQDRAPMTPVVKLVFGADYDKTRLTEYAAVLSHAHRVGVERGALAGFLATAEGGLKGVVKAERRIRREENGKAEPETSGPREAIASKLREIEGGEFDILDPEGSEFALVMIRRQADGSIAMLGEVPEDVALIERAARKLIG